MSRKLHRGVLAAAMCVACSCIARADGLSVDKVYSPYVQPLEQELEVRNLYIEDDSAPDETRTFHRLGYGKAFNESWLLEGYLTGNSGSRDDNGVEGGELELKHQLTEQGEYSADWGVMGELEYQSRKNAWESRATLITARDVDDMTFTSNLSLIYEWGDTINDELESAISLQGTYRLRSWLMPSLEFYASQYNRSVGPVVLGRYSLGGGRSLSWDAGVFVDVGGKGPESLWKINLEYNFF